ncbi:MAG: PIN domain-containing protein [Thermoproteota archaeon]
MKVLLDTTYLLPAIGISIKGIPSEALIKLTKKEYSLCISEISIFELSAKGAKYTHEGKLPPERVSKGIRAIVNDENITKIPVYDTTVLHLAFKLKSFLNDFIDCLILSSAITHSDILVTEDSDIKSLVRNEEFYKLLNISSHKLKVKTLLDII